MRAFIVIGSGVVIVASCLAMLLCSSPQASDLLKTEASNASGKTLGTAENFRLVHDSQTSPKPSSAPDGFLEVNKQISMPPSTAAASSTPRILEPSSPASYETAPVISEEVRPQVFLKENFQKNKTTRESAFFAPISSTGIRAIEVPVGEDLPLVLNEVMAEDEFTPAEIAKNAALAEEFLNTAARTDAVSQPKRWRQLVNQADELFRTWYGTDAFLAMESRRQRELINDQTASNP